MIGFQQIIEVEGRQVMTLRDILPEKPGLSVLFVAKTPAPTSVEAGHYFQGRQGTMFWNKLTDYGILRTEPGKYHDECLLVQGFGLTDIVKVPRAFGNEPSDAEYFEGHARILDLITKHKPKVTVFVYKKVLDHLLRCSGKSKSKSVYGFNPEFESLFGSKLFVFPMPGTPCNSATAESAMNALVRVLSE